MKKILGCQWSLEKSLFIWEDIVTSRVELKNMVYFFSYVTFENRGPWFSRYFNIAVKL
jgi:hypothetical protein